MVRRKHAVVLAAGLLLSSAFTVPARGASPGLLPDIRTIVPKQVQLVNAHQRELLRFNNGIANTGAGHWRMPEVVGSGSGLVPNAIQEILDRNGNVVDEHQGISPGWVDQYHQATEGQTLDITGLPAGNYDLVSTSNPDGNFVEADTTNNQAWVSFNLVRPNSGNAKVVVPGRSPCGSPGLCGKQVNNR